MYDKIYNPHRIVSTADDTIKDGPHRLESTAIMPVANPSFSELYFVWVPTNEQVA